MRSISTVLLSSAVLATAAADSFPRADELKAWHQSAVQATHEAGLAATVEELQADATAALMSEEDRAAQVAVRGVNERVTIESDGIDRTFFYYLPTAAPTNGTYPVMYSWHGLGGNGNSHARGTGMSDKAEEEGWVGIYPNGRSGNHNSGSCCGWSGPFDPADDVQFTKDAFAYMEEELGIPLDHNNVFGSGYSNGGFMSHRVACEMSDVFTAVAPHSGYLSYDCPMCADFRACEPEHPVHILHLHGTADLTVPFPAFWLHPRGTGFHANMEEWAELNGCDDEYTEVQHTDSSTSLIRPSCANGTSVEFVRVEGLRHSWSRASNGHIDATDYMFESFKKLLA